MEKIYPFLDWLTTREALNWLKNLTNTQVTESQLLSSCMAKQCDVYMYVSGVRGWTEAIGDEQEVVGDGFNKVLNADQVIDHDFPEDLDFCFEGQVYVADSYGNGPFNVVWRGLVPGSSVQGRFKPSDIQALAAKMNEAHNPLSTAVLSKPEEFKAGKKFSEAEVARLSQALDDECYSRDIVEGGAAKEEQKQQPEASTCGLTFPYATRELAVMLAAARKYWADYTSDKRQPTQKEIGLDIGESLGLPRQSSGDPARKAIILAAAIKPDTIPDS
ncbi:hypothetical protein SAMN05216296_2410 [Pseudomonas pohangensis]|uniref:Uncharacterized protein n=1 Tax=Pseudomonas pohangensis TaxID=364197 RepID=A0A1H2GMM3_9PSED|nr:hypothetical protein [Pseudomonas pohangensis]SDU20877.1 hypothetical protein SAMN05216296_2410 [Pseudomonas pohangensis]